MRVIHSILLLIILQLIPVSCGEQFEATDIISVSGNKISSEQVLLSYAFNPFLFKIKNEQRAKKQIVSSLIALQLLAIEAEKNGVGDTTIIKRIEAHRKEAIIEQFRIDSVEKTIHIDPAEVEREYYNALQEIEIAVFALGNNKKKQSKIRKLNWPIQDEALAKIVYSLDEGQQSKPIRTGNGVFTIKILNKTQIAKPSALDFNNRKQALQDHLLRRKIKQKYTRLFHKEIEPLMGTINRERFSLLSDLLAEKLTVPVKQQPRLFGSEKELPDDVILDMNFSNQNFLKQPIVSFPSGRIWSVKKLLNVLKYGPYAFNYSTPQSFKKSFQYNSKLLLEHQAIYERALKAGYGDNRQIHYETAIWKRYYSAEAFRYELLEKISPESLEQTSKDSLSFIQKKRLDFLDGYLLRLLKENKVSLNTDAWNNLNLEKTDMILMKSHFAHRLVVPMVEPLNGLPGWQKEMEKLFATYKIQ